MSTDGTRKLENDLSRLKVGELNGMKITDESFNPCPRCGSEKIALFFDQQLFSVYCEDCGLDTDCCFEPEEAVREWNALSPDDFPRKTAAEDSAPEKI